MIGDMMDLFKLASTFQKYANFAELQDKILEWGIKWDKRIEPKYISHVMNSMAKYETNPNSDTLRLLVDKLLDVEIAIDDRGHEWKFHRGDYNEISPKYYEAAKELKEIHRIAYGIWHGK